MALSCLRTPARTTDGTAAELPTSRIEIAADYRYAAQETENIAEAKSLACRKAWRLAVVNSPHPFAFIEGNVSTARHEYGGQTRLPGTRTQTPSARLHAVLTNLAGCVRFVNAPAEP
jgi:hypothetical protein